VWALVAHYASITLLEDTTSAGAGFLDIRTSLEALCNQQIELEEANERTVKQMKELFLERGADGEQQFVTGSFLLCQLVKINLFEIEI